VTGQWSYPAEPVTDPLEALDTRLSDIEQRLEYARDVIGRITELVSQLRAEMRQ